MKEIGKSRGSVCRPEAICSKLGLRRWGAEGPSASGGKDTCEAEGRVTSDGGGKNTEKIFWEKKFRKKSEKIFWEGIFLGWKWQSVFEAKKILDTRTESDGEM